MKLKYVPSWIVVFVMLIFSQSHIAIASAETALLDTNTNRTLIPIRFVSEQLGAKVDWSAVNKTVLIEDENSTILLKIGQRDVLVNEKLTTIDAPPFIINRTTYVPLRFVSTVLGAEVNWDSKTATVEILIDKNVIKLNTEPYEEVKVTNINQSNELINHIEKSFMVGGKKVDSNIVTVDLNDPSVDLEVALANSQVGTVEDLADIAENNEAILAINGTFFDAHTDLTEPYGVIIVDEKVVHIGKERTVFSFDHKNNVAFNIANPDIIGSTNGSDKRPNNWYSYGLNHTPAYNSSSSVIIYTQERGTNVGFNYGTNIVVEDGKVTKVTSGDVEIPPNGFVINLLGTEVHNLLDRFKVGTTVSYKIEDEGQTLTAEGAIGAGPRLITDGIISIDLEKEGFKEDKIIRERAARSAIGITNDNKLIMLTIGAATIKELAEVMYQVGAYQAMNLDGGSSSGLYYNRSYITKPGRPISNAILVKTNK